MPSGGRLARLLGEVIPGGGGNAATAAHALPDAANPAKVQQHGYVQLVASTGRGGVASTSAPGQPPKSRKRRRGGAGRAVPLPASKLKKAKRETGPTNKAADTSITAKLAEEAAEERQRLLADK
jgi:hypothetical protein